MGIRLSEIGEKFFEDDNDFDFKNPDFTITHVIPKFGPNGMCIEWAAKTAGFGQLDIYFVDGKLCAHTETMSKEFCKTVLNKLVDDMEIVDQFEKE